MKPEALPSLFREQMNLEMFRNYLKALKAEDPGIPKESEQIDPAGRYHNMAAAIRSLSDADKSNETNIKTPALKIESTIYQGTLVNLIVRFEVEDDPRRDEGSISAIVTAESEDKDVDVSMFRFEEWVNRNEVEDGEPNQHSQNRLNTVETLFGMFSVAARGLTPAEAQDLGFSNKFAEQLGKH
jgi:hypothetical protein